MGGDSRIRVLREVGIDSRCGVGGHQDDAIGDFAAHQPGRADHSHRLRVALDNDLTSGLDPFQNRPYIPSQIAFADVQRLP